MGSSLSKFATRCEMRIPRTEFNSQQVPEITDVRPLGQVLPKRLTK